MTNRKLSRSVMKMFILRILFALLFIVSVGSKFASNAHAQETTETKKSPKNIVYIMLDDADYFDFSFNNHHLKEGDARTPNIDSLRSAGRLMTRFYTASCICSPTRISVLTGCSPVRFGALDTWPSVRTVNQGQPGTQGLPSDIPHMGVVMRGLGKRTGHFGKWHVGLNREKYRPASMGFDEFTTYSNKKKVTSWAVSQSDGRRRKGRRLYRSLLYRPSPQVHRCKQRFQERFLRELLSVDTSLSMGDAPQFR